MRHPQLTTFAGLNDQCLTHYFIRVHGRAPSPEELADLRLRPSGSESAVTGTPRRGVRREIAKLIHRL